MNKGTIISTALGLSFLAIANVPVFALGNGPQTTIENQEKQTTKQTKDNTDYVEIIIVKFTKNIKFDAGGKEKQPVVLRIVESIYNKGGKLVIPAGSRIGALLVPTGKGKEKGTMIIAKSLIINGKEYPLNAISRNKIPANETERKTRLQQAEKYRISFKKAFPISPNLNGETQSQQMNKNTMIMEGLGAVAGFLSPRSKLVSNFSQGEEYILHLEKPLDLNTIQYIPVPTEDSENIQDSETNQDSQTTEDSEDIQDSQTNQNSQTTEDSETTEDP